MIDRLSLSLLLMCAKESPAWWLPLCVTAVLWEGDSHDGLSQSLESRVNDPSRERGKEAVWREGKPSPFISQGSLWSWATQTPWRGSHSLSIPMLGCSYHCQFLLAASASLCAHPFSSSTFSIYHPFAQPSRPLVLTFLLVFLNTFVSSTDDFNIPGRFSSVKFPIDETVLIKLSTTQASE